MALVPTIGVCQSSAELDHPPILRILAPSAVNLVVCSPSLPSYPFSLSPSFSVGSSLLFLTVLPVPGNSSLVFLDHSEW